MIYDFYADWCGPCKSLAPILESVAKERNIELKKINVDEDPDGLSVDYKIRSVPTIVVVENKVEIGRFSGTKSKEDLNKFFDNLNL